MLQLHGGNGAVPSTCQQGECDQGAVAPFYISIGWHVADNMLDLCHGRWHFVPLGGGNTSVLV
ncbi:MAG: hypothetical protein U9O82_01060 [Thermodesulfobacteriota bacterium]|nr:hypothetical protein [Thermodesulfobacteriota bacterium]